MADNTFNFDLDAPAVPTLTLDPVEAPAAEEKQPEPAAAPEAEQVRLSPDHCSPSPSAKWLLHSMHCGRALCFLPDAKYAPQQRREDLG